MAGAVARLYVTGTLTPALFYADDALVTSLGSSLTANGAGRFAVAAYQNESTPFRLRIEDAEGALLDDIDPFYFGYLEGATGPQGANATVLQLGTVTTAPFGFDADADITHLGGGVYELDLTLPRGATGASGALSEGDYGDINVTLGGLQLLIENEAVTNAKMAKMAGGRIKGNPQGGSSASPSDLTHTQVAAILDAGSHYVRQDAALVRSIPIMAGAMIARTTNGAASGTTETATNKIMVSSYDFDPATIEYTQFQIAMPKSWNEGTMTAQFIWSAAAVGDVVWQVSAVAISNDDVLDAAFGASVSVTDSVTAANDVMVSDFTGAMTVGGTPAEGDLVVFQISRNASNGADTCAVDAKLLGIRLNFTTNAKDDT